MNLIWGFKAVLFGGNGRMGWDDGMGVGWVGDEVGMMWVSLT